MIVSYCEFLGMYIPTSSLYCCTLDLFKFLKNLKDLHQYGFVSVLLAHSSKKLLWNIYKKLLYFCVFFGCFIQSAVWFTIASSKITHNTNVYQQ